MYESSGGPFSCEISSEISLVISHENGPPELSYSSVTGSSHVKCKIIRNKRRPMPSNSIGPNWKTPTALLN